MKNKGRLSGVALLAAAWGLLGALGCTTRVQHALEEREANRIVAALRQAGLTAEKVKEEGRGGRFAVEVPRGQASEAIGVLLAKDLPRRPRPGFSEVYGKPSLVPSAGEEQARFLQALSGELSRTLEVIRGVREARVHLVVPRPDPLALETTRSTPRASVLLRVDPGKPPVAAAEVQRLVAGGVEHLDPAAVSVVIHTDPATEPTRSAPRFTQVGPVSVSPDSRGLLLGLLSGGLALILLLGLAVALLGLRLGRLRQSAGASVERAAEPPEGQAAA